MLFTIFKKNFNNILLKLSKLPFNVAHLNLKSESYVYIIRFLACAENVSLP